jgi:hypothetical protein
VRSDIYVVTELRGTAGNIRYLEYQPVIAIGQQLARAANSEGRGVAPREAEIGHLADEHFRGERRIR